MGTRSLSDQRRGSAMTRSQLVAEQELPEPMPVAQLLLEEPQAEARPHPGPLRFEIDQTQRTHRMQHQRGPLERLSPETASHKSTLVAHFQIGRMDLIFRMDAHRLTKHNRY